MPNEPTRVVPGVPGDFPRKVVPTAIGGAQPKLTLRFVDGQYWSGATDEEIRARFEFCDDLVQQLTAYCERKQREDPLRPQTDILQHVANSKQLSTWCETADEAAWIVRSVASALRWPWTVP